MTMLLKRASAVIIALVVALAFIPMFDGGSANAASIKLNKKTVYLAKGATYKLKVKGTKAKVKWKSSNKKVAKVSKKGKITAKKIGKATITAKVKGKKLKCKVTVERPTVNKARKLRSYVLDKGAKDSGTYVIKKTFNEQGTDETVVSIEANKKNKKMVFDSSLYVGDHATWYQVTVTIDLISGKSALKKGKIQYRYHDGNGENSDEFYANITTAFDKSKKGLTLTKWVETVDGSLKTITDKAELGGYMNRANSSVNEALNDYDRLLNSRGALKKAKITMKSIGFTKWTYK